MKSYTSFRAYVSLSKHANISTGIANISHSSGIHDVFCVYVCCGGTMGGRVITSVHTVRWAVIAVNSEMLSNLRISHTHNFTFPECSCD